ncbi:MAG: hypothetical protein M3436_13635 [Pseudomonadota bacterium]|nr:hypothetical protein [Pseudomonadota bacterium]
MSADHVLDQLRLIRAENEKRDRELALMRAEFVVFRSQLDVFRTYLETIVSVLGTHTDTLQEINERLLGLQRQREGED